MYFEILRKFFFKEDQLIERHQTILKTVELLRSISVQELKERLDVSEVTIRKDLSFLEDEGLIVRTHGGARLAQDLNRIRTLSLRKRENPEIKKLIAQKASELIQEGDTIFLDSGSTCQALAEIIHDTKRSIRVITNALPIMNILAPCETVSIYTIGGSFRREAGSFIGPLSLSNLQDYQIEICFVGATGFDKSGTFTSQNVIESQVKKQVMASSRRRVILADSTKSTIQAFSVFARPNDIDILVTDNACTYLKELKKIGIEVIVVEKRRK